MGSRPESLLLPVHRKKATYPDHAVAAFPTTTDPPPPPSSSDADDDHNTKESEVPDFECSPNCRRTAILLFFLLAVGVPFSYVIRDQLAPYSPKSDVVSAFVTIKTINGSNPPAGGKLTADWAFTLHLDHSLPCCQKVHPYRVEASISHSAGGGEGGWNVLASTREFAGLNVVDRKQDDLTLFVQVGAEEAAVGEKVTAAVFKDLAELEQNRLRFRAVVLVWVRIEPNNFPNRFYLARISCDPFWTGSDSIASKPLEDTKECQIHVTHQSNQSLLDQNRTKTDHH